ncbi:Polysialic acid transport protein KpsD precursor [Marinobacterium sp. xm-a-121]|uniref:SLBB domain-containing protein n=1 Tax=unclassified Marinobacterium TaxID=2644139 RepID=UPI00156A5EF2|nr:MULTISPECIES: SLBB domain-containing protein [unclassified Marinobacterium]NRP39430.1 Polysialic acid transport protein KpsD precursor [Marinobacterium sp. xm-a-121]NRQ00231.1 Polysialic acid transport protein KpsD precursor [Marinobacterium sp. xm-v-233]
MKTISFLAKYLVLASLLLQVLSAETYALGLQTLAKRQLADAVIPPPNRAEEVLEEPVAIPVIVETPSVDEQPSVIEESASQALDSISLEEKIQSQSIKTELSQFGYDLFSGNSMFSASTGISVPETYTIGPGDTFVVQIYGVADIEYQLTVTRDGELLLPEVGALNVNGLSFTEAKLVINRELERQRVGVKTAITLSNLRTIQVLVVGEVERPGSYPVNAFSTLISTLTNVGGIKRSGSLRNIELKRNGKVVDTFDAYQLLLSGDDSANSYLKHGDVIFVPPIGRTVSIAGEVQRPAIYEIKQERTVDDLVKLSGGYLPTADRGKTQVERISDRGVYTLLQVGKQSSATQLALKSGDVIRVLPVLEKMDSVVLLTGHVLTPGGYQWSPGDRVSDLIDSPDLLRQGADFQTSLIQRELPSQKRTEVIYFSLEALFNGDTAADIKLQPRDQIIVFDSHSDRAKQISDIVQKLRNESTVTDPAPVVEVKGFVRHAGAYPLESGARLLDVLGATGGIKPGTDMEYAVLVRTDSLTDKIDVTNLSLRKALVTKAGDHNPHIKPRDRIYIFDHEIDRSYLLKPEVDRLIAQTPFGKRAPIVNVNGRVRDSGSFPMAAGMRLRDLIIAAGGMKEDAFGGSAILSRQYLLDGEFTKTHDLKVSVNESDISENGPNKILQPYDQLTIRVKPEWVDKPVTVTIEGEVLYPGTYRVDRRETLCGLVQHVGGFTEDAYTFGTVFLRESVKQQEQASLDRLMGQMDDLLAEVHMSPGVNKDTKMPVNQGANDTYQIIKRLTPEKAVGRLVIDMDEAVTRCREDADVVLENGDVIKVPKYREQVSVVGQVYFPTSHKFEQGKGALDYINLSGGTKELAQREHAYIVQANGEVMSVRSSVSTWGWLGSPSNVKVTPGSTVYVPLSVDRINGREFTETWIDMFYKLTLGAASVDFLFK